MTSYCMFVQMRQNIGKCKPREKEAFWPVLTNLGIRNHTLSNLEQRTDPNPFVSEYQDPTKPHPSKGIDTIKPTGWEREEAI